MSHVRLNAEGEPVVVPDQFPLAQLERLQRDLDQLREDLLGSQNRNAIPDSGDSSLVRLAKEILRSRRKREKLFGADLFGEPAWDILLELYLAELTHQRLCVSTVCDSSAVPLTTALRWIVRLERGGWIVRTPDSGDGRRSLVELSEEGSLKMRQYLSDLPIRAV